MSNDLVNDKQREKDNREMDMELKNNSEGWDPEASKKYKKLKYKNRISTIIH